TRGHAGDPVQATGEGRFSRRHDLHPTERAGADDEAVAGTALRRMSLNCGRDEYVSGGRGSLIGAVDGDVAAPLARGKTHGGGRDSARAEAGELAELHVSREPAHDVAIRILGRDRDRDRDTGRLVLGNVRNLEALKDDRLDQGAGPIGNRDLRLVMPEDRGVALGTPDQKVFSRSSVV